MCSMFQEGSTGGSWNSSGFKANAKSGNVGAVSMIFSCEYRSRFIRTLLEVSLGIFSDRYFMVPQSGGFLDKGGAALNASHAFLLSLKYSSAACKAATAIP